ncbi:hypothetical protein K438DRAFT_1819389 [Mycena galopus ATCC 62051]|nr:hypothetical protein K438DRAFT_1819389 [Mycena galopus ATCC 62051]
MSLLPGRMAGPDAFMEAARHVPWYRSLERSPWTLAHVSRYWRAVALTTPALWSSIIIRNMSDPRTQIYSQRMLEAQLSRSGRASLEIVFDYDPFNDESGSCVAEDALQTLAEHSERWKALYITGSQIARLAPVRGQLPLLEKLSVFGRDEGTDDGNSPPPPVDYFLNAPRLRTIEVNQGLPFFAVPWTQLTHYEALGTWAGHISALVCLKNVESCSFTIAHEDYLEDPYARRDETIEFPTLRQLQVTTERSYDHIEEYWVWPKWLRLPALTDLAIHAGLLYDLPELQLASAFSLNKLHLVAQYPAVEALRPVLLSNPHISELLLCVDGFRDFTRSKVPALLDFLALRPHHPDLLAELETLIIHSFTTGNHEDAVGRMIESRWRTTRLRAVHAVDIGPGLTSQLSRLKSQGMIVFIQRTVSTSLDNSYGDYKAPFQIDH